MAYEDPPSLQHDDPPSGPPRSPARLEEDLDLFQTLINQSNDAILIVDPETGLILYINHKACSNLGYTCEELLMKRFSDVTMSVRDKSSWNRLVKRVRTHGYALFEMEQRKKDWTRLPVEGGGSRSPMKKAVK